MRRVEGFVVGGTILALIGWAVWSGSWTVREGKRWNGCLGKKLAECAVPLGYGDFESGCADREECSPSSPGLRTLVARYPDAPETVVRSQAYAVLTLDRRDRIVNVEVRRAFFFFL